MRRLFLSFSFLIFCFSQAKSTGDSTQYLTPKDTIFLHVDDYGNKIFEHTMQKGQTLFSLSKFYGIKIYNLVDFNKHIEPENGFSTGVKINVPIPDSAIVKTYENGFHKAGFIPVYYMVKHGDNFYRIAKHYFNIPLDTLKSWNGLENTMMFTGMKLHVGYMSLDGIPDSLQIDFKNHLNAKMFNLEQKFTLEKRSTKPTFQNGAAFWQREKKGDKDYYCLHRTARIGSVIRIKNPMRGTTTYAKVIARTPDRAYKDDIIIVLSPSIAKILGAKDPKFYVELYYFE